MSEVKNKADNRKQVVTDEVNTNDLIEKVCSYDYYLEDERDITEECKLIFKKDRIYLGYYTMVVMHNDKEIAWVGDDGLLEIDSKTEALGYNVYNAHTFGVTRITLKEKKVVK